MPIAAAKPRLDSNGTSASTVHSESPLLRSEAAAVMIASSVAWAWPCPFRLGGCPRGGLQDVGALRVGGVGEWTMRSGCGRHRTHDAQSIFGQCAGLVEAYGVDPAQRFDGARSTNQHSVRRQPLRGGELGEGGHQRQALRTAATAIATPSATA